MYAVKYGPISVFSIGRIIDRSVSAGLLVQSGLVLNFIVVVLSDRTIVIS